MRRSRRRDKRAWSRIRTVKLLMVSPTNNITKNMKMYWVSDTAKEKRGGTKKKSKAMTLKKEARVEGPRL